MGETLEMRIATEIELLTEPSHPKRDGRTPILTSHGLCTLLSIVQRELSADARVSAFLLSLGSPSLCILPGRQVLEEITQVCEELMEKDSRNTEGAAAVCSGGTVLGAEYLCELVTGH